MRNPGNEQEPRDLQAYGAPKTWHKVVLGFVGLLMVGAVIFFLAFSISKLRTAFGQIDISFAERGRPSPSQDDPQQSPPVQTDSHNSLSDEEKANGPWLRVSGTDGLEFDGRIFDADSPEEGERVAGKIPQEYALQAVSGEGVYVDLFKPYTNTDDRGTLRLEVINEGKTVRQAETAAANGHVSLRWIPDGSNQADTRTGTATVEVIGKEGVEFAGHIGSGNRSWSIEGTVPQEYEVPVSVGGEYNPDVVRARIVRSSDGGSRDTLGARLLYGGEIVRQAETTARVGDVSLEWFTDEPDAPKTETVTVRVTGDEGLAFIGEVGSRGASWSVEGTVPQEYEIPVSTNSDPVYPEEASAYFTRSLDQEGELAVDLIYKNKVVKQGETRGEDDVRVEWSPE